MAVLHQTKPGALSEQERRELTETAQVFEMIVEANPLEVGALEALREIYVKLSDADKHADVVRRIEAAHGGPTEAPVAAETPATTLPPEPPPPLARAEPEPERPASRRGARRTHAEAVALAPPMPLPAPGPTPVAPAPVPAPAAAKGEERVVGRMGKLGDLLVSAGLITQEQLSQALASQRGTSAKTRFNAIKRPSWSGDGANCATDTRRSPSRR